MVAMATEISPGRFRLGPCMEPTYREGEEIEVFPVPRVVPGMVALIRAGGGYVFHRILDVIPPWAVHAGDAVPTPGLCRLSDVVGMPQIEVRGSSMEPTIPRCKNIQVVLAPSRGDVALIWTREGPLVHRILDQAGDWVIHAGDASTEAGFASTREVVGGIQAPPCHAPPALRQARILGLFLRLALPFHYVGLPVRGAARLVKNLLRSIFGRR
jgi:hypothetical protein